MVAPNPAHLAYAARLQYWWPGYSVTAAWVIDSFWTDRISRFARHRGHFDHIFVTDRELQDEWQGATGSAVSWLPWGTDTLAAQSTPQGDRPTDLLRLGRQPEAWDDDTLTKAHAEALGMVMAGRPPMAPDSRKNQMNVRRALNRAKFVLAFSNLVSPADYTHPTRDYLTGRWMDALAAGVTVAGVAPRASTYTLWPGATLEIDPDNQAHGLAQIREALDVWTPETARRHRRLARQRLDWRWRLDALSRGLGLPRTAALDTELQQLQKEAP